MSTRNILRLLSIRKKIIKERRLQYLPELDIKQEVKKKLIPVVNNNYSLGLLTALWL